jgi:hypothetical protein
VLLELGRDSRRGKVPSTIVKYWLCLLCVDSQEIVITCYKWQINNLKVESWAKKLKEELEKIGLVYIWQSRAESNAIKICKIIRERCTDRMYFEHKQKDFLGILL